MADPRESETSENKASVNLVELFQAGENGIERRRTDNLFKQLDERQLTEDEQAIIQQRVDLQRKMFQEYERREKQRKLRELQEVCPDLDEDAARRALELCNWKEEAAAERVSSDPAFLRRVLTGAAPAVVEHAPAPKPERQRSSGSRAVVGPRPRLVDPSQVGAVFVGRFKSRLGPHQISAMGRQPQLTSAVANAAVAAARGGVGTTSSSQQQQVRRPGSSAAAILAASDSPAAAGAGKEQQGSPGQVAQPPAASHAHAHALAGEGDVEMADAGRAVEPDSGELAGSGEEGAGLAAAVDGCESETEHGEEEEVADEEDGEMEGPNSADLSDNELQYEDDVMPVMSPLAGKRQRAVSEQPAAGEAGGQGAVELPSVSGHQPPQAPTVGAMPQQTTSERADGGNYCAAGPLAARDEDEVSSPSRGRVATVAVMAAAAAAAAAAALAATAAITAAPEQLMGAAARPRRAKAELAAVLRHVEADSDDGDARSGAETATDAGDSDFKPGSGGRGDGGTRGAVTAAGASDMETSSSGSDIDLEEDSDDFVAPGSRKRRAGAAGTRRQQQARKRAASGGSAATAAAATRATRQRNTAATAQQRAAEVPSAPPGAAAIAVAAAANATTTVPAAATLDGAGPSGRGGDPAGEPAAAGPSGQAPPPAAGNPNTASGDSEATVTEDESPGRRGKRQAKGKKGRGSKKSSGSAGGGSVPAGGGAAISASGHTCRGRVKQKGVKRADLLSVGMLIPRQGWFNAGYIFPAGFRAQTLFRSSVDLDSLTLHTCEILGETGQYWPAPTFVVTAADRPDEPLVAKSCTGCWTAVLRRINSEIEGRRAAGEDLPPPPKTAIAGPEYFGLNQPEICAAIEALDPDKKCTTYWDGKMDREAARGGQPVPSRGTGGGRDASGGSGAAAAAAAGSAATAARPPRGQPRSTSNGGGGGSGKGRRGGRRASGADDGEEEESGGKEGEDDPEETYAGNRWSAVTRAERYRKRCEDAGEDAAALLEQSKRDNPLPGFLDPITLEPVFNPAISPYGHVMGLATWKAVLAEHGRCPFTKQPLKPEALTVLTKNNIERYRSRIIQQ